MTTKKRRGARARLSAEDLAEFWSYPLKRARAGDFGVLCRWLRGGLNEVPEEVRTLIADVLDGSLKFPRRRGPRGKWDAEQREATVAMFNTHPPRTRAESAMLCKLLAKGFGVSESRVRAEERRHRRAIEDMKAKKNAALLTNIFRKSR